jgi:hypothetical protein
MMGFAIILVLIAFECIWKSPCVMSLADGKLKEQIPFPQMKKDNLLLYSILEVRDNYYYLACDV